MQNRFGSANLGKIAVPKMLERIRTIRDRCAQKMNVSRFHEIVVSENFNLSKPQKRGKPLRRKFAHMNNRWFEGHECLQVPANYR